MNKSILIVNGVAKEADSTHFLVNFFMRSGYQVEIINILSRDIKLDQIRLNKKHDVILGFSLGGLVVQRLGADDPGAKLILVATGARVKPNGVMNLLVRVASSKWGIKMAYFLIRLPDEIITSLYRVMNPIAKNSGETSKQYIRGMKENLKYFRTLGVDKWMEIAGVARSWDNRECVEKLKNQTLIISGKKDKLMPVVLGDELRKLITNSVLIMTSGGHFDVIKPSELEVIMNFVQEDYQESVLKREGSLVVSG